MNIHAAIKHIQAGGCACKYTERALEKLFEAAAAGIHTIDITFSPHSVVLALEKNREVLCSRFFEQRG